MELIEFAGIREGRLRFEIEVVLPAIDPRAFENVFGIREGSLPIAACDPPRRPDELLLALRVVDREDRLQLFDIDLDGRLREAYRFAIFGGDHDNRLPDERHNILGQQDFVLDDRAEKIVRKIVIGVERDDAGNSAGGGRVERPNAAMCHRRPEMIDDQLVFRERHVVDVQRLARDVAGRRVVRNVFADGRHALTSCQNLLRMFSASCRR